MLLCSSPVVDLAYVKASVFDRDVTDVDVTYNIAVNSHVLTNQKPEREIVVLSSKGCTVWESIKSRF